MVINTVPIAFLLITGFIQPLIASSVAPLIPKLDVKHLKSLVATYHVNRELNENFDVTIEQLKGSVTNLAAQSEELQISAKQAYELIEEKIKLLIGTLPADEAQKLEKRQNTLIEKLMTEGNKINANMQQVTDGLKKVVNTRLLLFRQNETSEVAHKRLRYLLNYQYNVHGEHMRSSDKRQIRRLLTHLTENNTQVFIGEPINDITSSSNFDPNNTVFSRHPENLRHLSYNNAHLSANSAPSNDETIISDDILKDVPVILNDFNKDISDFANSGMNYADSNLSKVENDPISDQVIGLISDVQRSYKKNDAAVKKLASLFQ